MSVETINWIVFIAYGVWMFSISPWIRGTNKETQFFKGRNANGSEVSLLFLSSSLLISWIFAKSIQNAANLGQSLGLPGGVAYATYWLSFITAAYILFSIRQVGFTSLHQFLTSKYGAKSIWLFSLILLFRLWNEIWSNTIVIGQFFGEQGSFSYYLGTWTTTIVVLAYALKGGLRSSIITDTVQMGLFVIVLLIIVAAIFPQGRNMEILTSGEWTMAGGVDLILVALIQIWSYPFHDPVLTDRAFITEAKKMKRAFLIAGIAGVGCILLFSLTGVFNQIAGIGGNATLMTARYFGLPILIAMNIIMLVSATSTLDSTLTSSGKLVAVDLFPGVKLDKILLARIALVVSGRSRKPHGPSQSHHSQRDHRQWHDGDWTDSRFPPSSLETSGSRFLLGQPHCRDRFWTGLCVQRDHLLHRRRKIRHSPDLEPYRRALLLRRLRAHGLCSAR